MLTIIFYAVDGRAAKARAKELSQQRPKVDSRVYDASIWNGEDDQCDTVEIMPCVPQWYRDRIDAVYGHKIAGQQSKLEPQSGDVIPLTATHRGRGKFYVMRGDEIVSGPHSKDEAQRIVAA